MNLLRSFLCFFIAFLLICASFAIITGAVSLPSVSAKSAVLIDADTGNVLYEKNASERLPMASTTKIMTAIVALENSRLSDKVAVSKNAVGVEGS